jgi:hypothetical protein
VAGVRGAWRCLSGTARGLAGVELGLSELRRELVGTEEDSPVARELVQGAWHDLEQRLAAELGLQPGPAQPDARPDQSVWRRWSGALLLSVPWWSAQLRLLVAGESIERFLIPSRRPAARKEPSDGLVPLAQAVSSRSVQVEVMLDAFELDVGALSSMRVGDVVRTTHRTERPLLVNVGAAQTESVVRWSGFLGRAGSNKAVELAGERGGKP